MFLALSLGLATAATSALAQDSEIDSASEFDVVYEAPTDCPERSEVVRQIHERLRVDRAAPPPGGGRDAGHARYAPVVIQIDVAPDGTQAELRYSDTQGHEVTRRVRGDTCADVIDALSLVAAMSLRDEADRKAAGEGPRAEAQAGEGQSAEAQSRAAPSGAAPGSTVAEITEPRAAAPAAPPPAYAPPSDRPAPKPRRADAEPWRWMAGVQVSATDIVAEETAGGIAALVGISHPGTTVLRPRFRLSIGQTGPATASSDDDEAEFTLRYVRGEACPLAWPPTGMFMLRPCVSIEGGSLEGAAQRTDNSTDRSILWSAVSATGAAELVPFRQLGLELQAGLVVPLVSDRFYMRPGDELLHEVPDYGWLAGASVVVVPQGR